MFNWYMDLMYDPVPNVRLHSCSLLPQMKQTVKLPDDVDQLVLYTSQHFNCFGVHHFTIRVVMCYHMTRNN